MSSNLYETLGIEKDATDTDIKKAYRKLAIKHHPDKGGDEETFKKISHAYGILSNTEKRKQYDMFGTYDDSMPQNMPDFNDIFENIFQGGGMGQVFGSMFGNPIEKKSKGKDKTISLSVTLEEVFTGKTIKYRLLRKKYLNGDKCKECDGKGKQVQMIQLGPGIITQNITCCPICNGSGIEYNEKFSTVEEEIIDIPIPKGIPSGHRLAIRGKGDHYGNLPPGDIIVTIEHKPHSLFEISKRNVLDIIYRKNITLYELIYGFQFTFQLLDNQDISIKCDKGIHFIEKPLCYRIPKKGFFYKNITGDLLLHIHVYIPKSIEDIQKIEEKESIISKNIYRIENLHLDNIDI